MIDNHTPIVRRFALNKIHPDANARLEFDTDKLQELADSLTDTKGVLQPLLGTLRPDGEVDLIAGERRWRASGLAGFTEVEVKLVDKPSRKDHLKWNLVENLQRENLKPIETALRVQDMLTLTDEATALPLYNRASLAAELGISPESVGRYEALLKAPEKVQKAVNDEGLDILIAALIGGLPESMRGKAASDIVFRVYGGPMNRKQAQDYVAELRRDLRKGQFNRDDESLVPDAGACGGCPFFGGNREDVAGKARGYTCLNPECFDRKQQAHVQRVADAAEREGTRVLGQNITSRIFQSYNNELSHNAGYVDVKAAPDGYLLKDTKGTKPTWEKILKETGAPVVIAFDHAGRVRRLVETKVAVEAAKRTEYAEIFKPKAGEDVASADDNKSAMQITKAKNKASKAALLEGLGEMFQSFSSQAWSREVRLELLSDLCSNQTKDDLELLCRTLQPDLKTISNASAKLKELIDLRLDTNEKIDAFILIARSIRGIHFNGFHFTENSYSRNRMIVYCEWAGFDAQAWDKKMKQRIKDAEGEAKAAIREKNKPVKKAKGARPGKGSKDMNPHKERTCRVCGCTEEDCSGCIEKSGGPCHWVETDLCSACADDLDYHCDKCGLVCGVSEKDVPKIEVMPFGEFLCAQCMGKNDGFCGFPYDAGTQELYETWKPGEEMSEPGSVAMTDEQWAFFVENPKCNVTDLQKQFNQGYTEALALFDAMVERRHEKVAPKESISIGRLAPGAFGKGPGKVAGKSANAEDYQNAQAAKSGIPVAEVKLRKPALFTSADIEAGAVALMNETITITELIGPKPDRKKDELQYKTWNSVRMKLLRKAGLAA